LQSLIALRSLDYNDLVFFVALYFDPQTYDLGDCSLQHAFTVQRCYWL